MSPDAYRKRLTSLELTQLTQEQAGELFGASAHRPAMGGRRPALARRNRAASRGQ